jgi:hypothetical protein
LKMNSDDATGECKITASSNSGISKSEYNLS